MSLTRRDPIGIEPWLASMMSVGLHDFLLQRRRRGHHLERGARLVDVLDRPVLQHVLVDDEAKAFGLNVGSLAMREDLAGPRVHDDGGAALRVVLLYARLQLAFGNPLQRLVDGELTVAPVVGGRSVRLNALRRASVWMSAVPGRPLMIESMPLDAAKPRVVEPDVAEHVRRQRGVRVIPPVLLHAADAIQIQGGNAPRLVRRDLAPHPRERTAATEPLAQRLRNAASQPSSALHRALATRSGSRISLGTA